MRRGNARRERYSRARNEFMVTIPVEEYRELVANNAKAVFRLNRLSGQLNFCKKKSAPVSAPAIRKESPFKANCYIHYTKERKES